MIVNKQSKAIKINRKIKNETWQKQMKLPLVFIFKIIKIQIKKFKIKKIQIKKVKNLFIDEKRLIKDLLELFLKNTI